MSLAEQAQPGAISDPTAFAELTTDRPRPQPTCSSGWGSNRRCTAAHRMPKDTPTMSSPSKPEEKYSALWWP